MCERTRTLHWFPPLVFSYWVCPPILLLDLWSTSRHICQEPFLAQGPPRWVPLFPPLFPTVNVFFRLPVFPPRSNKSNETNKRKHLSNSVPNSAPSSLFIPFLPRQFHLFPDKLSSLSNGEKKRPPLHSQQQGRKTSIIPSASDPQHLFTYPYNFPERSKSIPWTFVAKGDLRAPETGQRTYSSTPHHSTRYGYPRNDGIFVARA
jgi:hypothetical protein